MAGGIRTFVALELPEHHRELLAEYLADCARRAPAHRWVEPDSLHLTLRFLGNVEPDVLDLVRDRLAGVHAAPFPVALGHLGVFGPRSAPRVVWIGVDQGLGECVRLAAAVEEACQAAGLDPEERGFRAHVTMARARSEDARLPDLPAPPALPPWTAGDFVLFESRLRQLPRYVPLDRYPLA